MYTRRVLTQFKSWASAEFRKPLILRGARQVGKTTAVRLFGQSYDRYLELNLERTADAGLFEKGLSAHDILSSAHLLKRLQPVKGSTLLFIDEIQNSPAAFALLRFFAEDLPHIHVIAAGSLLEVMMGKKHFEVPVGRVNYLYMYPLSFVEFLEAIGEDQLAEAWGTVPCPEYARDILLERFHTYALIGGMPEAVARYTLRRDPADLSGVYADIIQSYLDDVPKYAVNDGQAAVLRHCIEATPFESGKRVSFAGFGRSDYRSREAGEALRTLERAMLLFLCYPSTSTQPPMQPDLRKAPRLQFLDMGLLNHMAGIQNQYIGIKDLHGAYRGTLAEQIVGQELLALNTHEHHKPVFWVRENPQSNAEVDYLFGWRDVLVPVEVKAGSSGSLRSLHQFMDACPHDMAVRLWAGNLAVTPTTTIAGKPFRLLNLPYYLAGKIREYLDWAFGG